MYFLNRFIINLGTEKIVLCGNVNLSQTGKQSTPTCTSAADSSLQFDSCICLFPFSFGYQFILGAQLLSNVRSQIDQLNLAKIP